MKSHDTPIGRLRIAALWCLLSAAIMPLEACDKSDRQQIAQGAARVFGGSSSPGSDFLNRCVTYPGGLTSDGTLSVKTIARIFESLDKSRAKWRRASEGWIAAFATHDDMSQEDGEEQAEFDQTSVAPTAACPQGTAYLSRISSDDKEFTPYAIGFMMSTIETNLRRNSAAVETTATSSKEPERTSSAPSPIVPVGSEEGLPDPDRDDVLAGRSMLSGVSGSPPQRSSQTATSSTPPPAPAAPPPPRYIEHPLWLSIPSAEQLGEYYPDAALRSNVAGEVTLQCTVTAQGHMTACNASSETPEGLGFGQAAIRISRFFTMGPLTAQGIATAGGIVSVPIKFAQTQ